MRRMMRATELFRSGTQARVMGPQCSLTGQPRSRKKMHIDIANSEAKQTVLVDQMQNLFRPGGVGLRHAQKHSQREVARMQVPERQLANDKGMNQDRTSLD